jgi:kynurenine formamidase
MVGKVVSLSHSISPRIPLWPGDPSVVFEDIASLSKDGYFLRRFSMGEHSATHMNAPNSFYADGIGIDGYQPHDLVRPAVVIDVRAGCTPDYEISVQDIQDWENQHGNTPITNVAPLGGNWSKWVKHSNTIPLPANTARLVANVLLCPGSTPWVSMPTPATWRWDSRN